MKTGKIVDIKRFAVHDGDGIRTTVFFKGCSLKCVWCHNPESIKREPQLAYYEQKCLSCMECAEVCPSGAHEMNWDKGHVFDRTKCIACGACEPVCLGDALKLWGREMTVEELIPLLLEDREFYQTSQGGVTLSGGECLLQADFCAQLLQTLKEEGIHTAVDTCGFVSWSAFEKVLPYTDIFLYDIKAFDPEVHKMCTGQSNEIILQNLKLLDETGAKIEIRIPYVPDYNSDQMEKIRDFLAGLSSLPRVKVLPYHNFAGSKYEALGMENTLPERMPSQEEVPGNIWEL